MPGKEGTKLRRKRAWFEAQWETAKEFGLAGDSRRQDLRFLADDATRTAREQLKQAEKASREEGRRAY